MKFVSSTQNYTLLLLIIFAISGCSKKEGMPPVPEQAQLLFPAQNALCTSGTVLSSTQAAVTLTWSASDHTDSYEVAIKDLLTGAITSQSALTNKLTVSLLRNTPYAWYVVSLSNATAQAAKSDTWRFYVAGEGAKAYSPYPAQLTAPAFGASVAAGAINLTWIGSDVDNDITSYDIYFGTAPSPPLLKAGVTDMLLNNITVTSGNTYYWRVVTKDSMGNTSDSGAYQFKVN